MSYGGILGKSTTTWTNDQILSTATAGLYGLGADALPTQALSMVPWKINPGWKKIQEYTTAGAVNWTAPDLFSGKSYTIGVLIIGGGGAGGVATVTATSTSSCSATGGASGYTLYFLMQVNPNQQIQGVVGAGGAAVTATGKLVSTGNNGGATSFNGKSASGGFGGNASENDLRTDGAYGAQNSTKSKEFTNYTPDTGMIAPFGGVTYEVKEANQQDHPFGVPSMCYNPFEFKRILGAGGFAVVSSGDSSYNGASYGGKDPISGLGGGDGVFSFQTTKNGLKANSPGCGGGGLALLRIPISASFTSGAGADGAIYIYALGA